MAALFTSALAVFSCLLFQASRDSNNALVLIQRAFISFAAYAGVRTELAGSTVTGYDLAIGWVNSGATPTKIASYQVAYQVQNSPIQENTDFNALPQGAKVPLVIGPRETVPIEAVVIPLSDMESVANKTAHAFVWGWIEYRDIFQDTPVHVSEFCREASKLQWSKSDHSDPTTSNTP